MVALHLVLGLHDGTGCLLSDGATAPVEGRLSRPDPLPDGFPGLAPERGVELPGADARASRREREAALRLLDALLDGDDMGRVRDLLLRSHGRAEQQGGPLLLAIDARTPRLRSLPWELLGALRQDEASLWRLQVVRVVEGGAASTPSEPAGTLEVLGWCPHRDDPLCAQVARSLERTLAGVDQAVLSWFDLRSGLGLDLPARSDRFRILHVICHGERELQEVLLRVTPGERASADTAARVLRSALETARLVVLDVCGGAGDARAPLDAPAARLVAAGAPICVGPRLAFAVEASELFTGTLYRALVGGARVVGAVEAARSALACRLAIAHPHWRWWNPAVLVSHVDVLLQPPPIEERPTVPGWPAGHRRLDPVVGRALELAAELGFLGVEQLALALMDEGLVPGGRSELAGIGDEIRQSLAALRPRKERPDLPPVTQRLRRLGELLPEGFGPEALGVLLFESRGLLATIGPARARRVADGLAARVDPATVQTLLTAPTPATGLSAQGAHALATIDPIDGVLLEVLGGPDDGLELLLARPGRVVGRWSPDSEQDGSRQLFAPPRPDSNLISRRHLVFGGGREISVHRRTTLLRDGDEQVLRPGPDGPARIRLQDGDILTLRDAVHLAVHTLVPDL